MRIVSISLKKTSWFFYKIWLNRKIFRNFKLFYFPYLTNFKSFNFNFKLKYDIFFTFKHVSYFLIYANNFNNFNNFNNKIKLNSFVFFNQNLIIFFKYYFLLSFFKKILNPNLLMQSSVSLSLIVNKNTCNLFNLYY